MRRHNHLPTGAKPREQRVLTERQFLRLILFLPEDTLARNQANQRAHQATLADAAEEFSHDRGLAEGFRRLGSALRRPSR